MVLSAAHFSGRKSDASSPFFQLVEEEERLQDLMSIQALELSNIKEFQVKYFRQWHFTLIIFE